MPDLNVFAITRKDPMTYFWFMYRANMQQNFYSLEMVLPEDVAAKLAAEVSVSETYLAEMIDGLAWNSSTNPSASFLSIHKSQVNDVAAEISGQNARGFRFFGNIPNLCSRLELRHKTQGWVPLSQVNTEDSNMRNFDLARFCEKPSPIPSLTAKSQEHSLWS